MAYTSSLNVSEYSLTRETPADTVCRLERMFMSALMSPIWRDWRKHADEDFRFYEGEHWTALEKALLQERGQPEVTENLIKPKIERLLGQFLRQHSTVSVLGRNASVDTQTAETAADLFKYVDQTNGAEFEESDQIKDGFIGGFGVLEAVSEPGPDGAPYLCLRQENPFYIFPDPHSRRYDWNDDAKFICRSKWLDVDDAIALWPDKARDLRNCVTTSPGIGSMAGVFDPTVLRDTNWNYFDSSRQRLRPVEVYYKRTVMKRILITESGVRVELDYLGPRQARQASPGSTLDSVAFEELWLGIYCGGTLIYHDRFQDQDGMFPFIPYFADRKKSGEPMGPVRNLVSISKEIDKRRSKALHLLSTNQAILSQNAVEDVAAFTEEKAKPDGTMVIRGKPDEMVQLIKNQDMGQSQMAMHAESKQAFNMVSGDDPTNQGQASQMRSGVGKAREQMATDLVNMPLFTNIRRTRRIKLKKVWGLICQHFTSDLIFQITDDPNAAKVVTLPKSRLDALREMQFNFVISDVEDSLTLQTEQFEIVATLLPQILPLGIGPAKFLLELSNIKPKQKDGLLKMLDGMAAQPPPEPKISLALDWSKMQPEERAIWAATKLNMPALADFLMKEGQGSTQAIAAGSALAKQSSVERMNDKRQEVDLITHGSQLKADMIGMALDHKAKMTKAEADQEQSKELA